MNNLETLTSQFVQLMVKNCQEACIRQVGVVTKMITKSELSGLLQFVLPGVPMLLNDEKYAVTSIFTWEKIIALDWTARKKYVTDTFDCDNFSDTFRAHAAEIYNLNSAGGFHCIVQADNGTVNKTGHRAVLICALDENNQLALYAMESETGAIGRITKGQPIKLPVFGTTWNYSASDSSWN